MEISAWDIHLLTRLKGLNFILAFATVIPLMIALIHFVFNQGEINGLVKRFVVSALVACLLWIFIPNEREAAAMYVLPKLVNNEAAQNLPKDLAALVHDWAEELSTRTKKKGDRE